jgi:signal transduction histidine kinase/CheY-like chemotaxis protein
LESIFRVVVRSLEDNLPADFVCVCLYDAAEEALSVAGVGVNSAALAQELTLGEQAKIDVDDNGLGRCVHGELVYEPDIGELASPFPERLADGGLGAVVMAPLKSESRVFGVLMVARREARSFSSVECEFLGQLSEHVALAAHQAQLYEALRQAYDDLRQTQETMMQEERLRALGQMASGIAHDINNALSPVSLYTESMLQTEQNLSERGRGHLEVIRQAVEDVAETVARMREFYRPREQQLELSPVALNELVGQVLDLTRARWSDMALSQGIVVKVVTELAPKLPKIMGVESEIREALTNLIFNAVDAMPEGGTLTLRTRIAGGDVEGSAVVEVVDTGIGMDEQTQLRCLEPFFTTKGERGTGLGLAMVFGMVQRHSCAFEIDSARGEGTTMRLVFAVQTGALDATGHLPALKIPKRLRLLLVDDDPILLKSLRDTLETDGHVIVTASGGEEGIAAFRMSQEKGERFAAVFTDLGMPYVDGRQVAEAVKEVSPTTPVIMLTGWGRRLEAEGDIPPHVDKMLAKPPKLREVREALIVLCCERAPA